MTAAAETALLDALHGYRRILLVGPSGAGKSTLAAQLGATGARLGTTDARPGTTGARLDPEARRDAEGARLRAGGRRSGALPACIGGDPGSPSFGIPGAICLGQWHGEGWRLVDFEPICSLDAARFRLPLVRAVEKLIARAGAVPLVLDAPGVVRGVAAAELLTALAESFRADVVLLVERDRETADLEHELAALAMPIRRIDAAAEARPQTKPVRARQRTALWNAYLEEAEEARLDLRSFAVLGTPPPTATRSAVWRGRQIALLEAGRCIAMGEAVALDGAMLSVRLRGRCTGADSLLVRDAVRRADGSLGTAEPQRSAAAPQRGAAKMQRGPVQTRGDEVQPPCHSSYGGAAEVSAQSSEAPRPRVRTGSYTAALLNGVFDDPLLLVRLLHASRSVLFDLGEAARLQARVAHQVTDVFLSHAHADHIAGFLSFLRARIGDFPPCRIFGPPGLAENIAGLVSGFHWDRAGERGPRFEVAELHAGHRLVRFEVTIHAPRPVHVGEAAASEAVLQADALFAVRAALLDHRTPVLAYALEPPLDVKVRKERLETLGLRPGPWLTQLKLKVLEGRDEDRLEIPGSEPRTVRSLTDDLLVVRPGPKLVYATDFADTADNRRRLTALAQGADVFFCESTFCAEHRAQAERTGHLTAQACGEIAAAAGVERLAPFHFSKRYEGHAPKVYAEIAAAYGGSIVGWNAAPKAGRHSVRRL